MKDWKVTSETVMPAGDNPLGNRFYGYRRSELELPDGKRRPYFGILVPPCVHVVAVEPDGTTYLVRQKRPNIRRLGELTVPETLELPGGFANPELGLDQLDESANIELRQEIGRSARQMTALGPILPSTGASNEYDYAFLATDLEKIDDFANREATEQDMRIISGPFGQMYDQLLSSELPVSGQTIAAMAKASRIL